MILIFNRFIMVLIFLCASVNCVGANKSKIIDQANYNSSNDGQTTYYSKIETSGCTTTLKVSLNSSTVALTYGGRCDINSKELESVKEIAHSFIDIIKHNKLDNVLKTKNLLSINIVWKISHWPLIKFINEDAEWPKDFSKFFINKYSDKNVQHAKYKAMLGNEIVKQDVYLPFIESMKNINCDVKLSKNFADPVFFDKKYMTNEKLIKWKVFSPQQARKNIYPLIKGPIEFDIICN